ncbi:DEAD/DEAH box helicase [Pedobacter ghigonis]|uniref:DEAD/DEAH box helicase n=1 Tax=Pedobacter ghigonis TaxID=2730403 RepID=UPI00158EBD32|nr:DEAD/DEAH box helicase [Pedobacter ghigonis]
MANNKLIEDIYEHPVLDKVINALTYNEFFHSRLNLKRIEISFDELRKAIWLTSILATSEKDLHRNKAQLLSSLVFLDNPDKTDFARAAYILFSRLGNLTGTGLLRYNGTPFDELSVELTSNFYDAVLSVELNNELTENTLINGEERIVATRYQRGLWDQLSANNNLVISAPTSSGKSFVVRKFVEEQIGKFEKYNAVYIVPSRALINQVSEEFRKDITLSDVNIKTVFIQDVEKDPPYNIYILTPERCLRLLKIRWEKEFPIDFIFVDEIQNVEDTQGRGTLFEYVFREMSTLFPKAKIVAAGPYIDKPEQLYVKVFETESLPIVTTVSPVFQIRTSIRPLENERLKITVSSLKGSYRSLEIEISIDLKKRFSNIGVGIKDLVKLFAKPEEQNIIYCPKGNYTTIWAGKFSEPDNQPPELSGSLKDLIEFVEEEIHPMYELIPCLKQKTAYHHGYLPEIVRKEIEYCFLEGAITNLFCTTTLLQGVNLPANNLFIPIAEKRNIKLTPFDFSNLMGRAGRIRNSLYGTIYCIERDESEWSTELYERASQKVVKPASEIALEDADDLIGKIQQKVGYLNHKENNSAPIFFLQKYLQGSEGLESFLNSRNIDPRTIERLSETLSEATSGLSIPYSLLRLNPSIDPRAQDVLYNRILQDGVEAWMITPPSENKNFNVYLEEYADLEYRQLSFYLQLESIIDRLNGIFLFTAEAFWVYGLPTSARQLCLNAYSWLQNKTFREIIDADLKFYESHSNDEKKIDSTDPKQVNYRINQVIKGNNTLITHILIKYMKLLNDLIEPSLSEQMKERYKFSLALPTMLELGTNEAVVISLISAGISRSIALKVFRVFSKIKNPNNLTVFQWMATHDELPLKPIYNRYLKRMNLLKRY